MLKKASNCLNNHPKIRKGLNITLLTGIATGLGIIDTDHRIHNACHETRNAVAKTACTALDAHSCLYGTGSMNPENIFAIGDLNHYER